MEQSTIDNSQPARLSYPGGSSIPALPAGRANRQSKILIIDDDETLGESLRDVLELKDYLVEVSHTAADGIKKVESSFRNVVLLDKKLPDSDGIEVLEKIKDISPDTEVIIFTAYAEMDSVINAMDRGAFSFLPKPFEIPYMLNIINSAIEKQHIIFDNHRLLQETKESEERFRSTFEQAAVGISHVAPNGQFLRINKRFCDIIGYTEEEMLKLTFQDITYPDDLNADLNLMHQVLDDKIKTYTIEKRYIKKDSSIVWTNLTVSLVYDNSGGPRYFISVIEDITKQKQAVGRILSLASILEDSLNEIYIFDAGTLKFL